MARRSKNIRRRSTIGIVGDGNCEKEYFRSLAQEERLQIKLKPELPQAGDYKYVFKKARELLKKEYDRVYCLIDLDKIIADNKIKEFKSTIRNMPKKIYVLESLPCFEFWYLFHFTANPGILKDDQKAIKKLKLYIPDYDKGEFYRKNNIYKKLRSKLERAVKNAENNVIKRKTGKIPGNYSKSEIYLFFKNEV